MATRSRIAIETTDTSGNKVIKSIYCHFDGYPSGVGKTLMENYQAREKVEALISLGDISFIKEEVTPTGPHIIGIEGKNLNPLELTHQLGNSFFLI